MHGVLLQLDDIPFPYTQPKQTKTLSIDNDFNKYHFKAMLKIAPFINVTLLLEPYPMRQPCTDTPGDKLLRIYINPR